jgi:hypothetical protein
MAGRSREASHWRDSLNCLKPHVTGSPGRWRRPTERIAEHPQVRSAEHSLPQMDTRREELESYFPFN